MATSTASTFELDAFGRLSTELNCIICGHNLRGLTMQSRCGECGDPVAVSMQGGSLNMADPEWVERLRSGVACLSSALPWMWIPLVWPFMWWGFWKMTSTDRSHDAGAVIRWLSRVGFAGIPLGATACLYVFSDLTLSDWMPRPHCVIAFSLAAMLMLVAVSIAPIARASRKRWLRGMSRSEAVCSAVALALTAIGGLYPVSASTAAPAFFFVFLLGCGLTALNFVTTYVLLLRLWWLLEIAAVQSRAFRVERRLWQGTSPLGVTDELEAPSLTCA